MKKSDLQELLELGLLTGSLLLMSGAEVYRTEDTIQRMLAACGSETTECVVTPTAIYLSVSIGGELGTKVKRIRVRSLNLALVSAINTLSRSLAPNSEIQDVRKELLNLANHTRGYTAVQQIGAAALGAGAFGALFGGRGLDLVAAALAGSLVFTLARSMGKAGVPRLLVDFAGGLTGALTSLSLTALLPTIHYDRVIIGSIMSLVPGVLLTSAVRDMLSGDLVSGSSRMMEALFVAAAIAAGVGVVLGWWLKWMSL